MGPVSEKRFVCLMMAMRFSRWWIRSEADRVGGSSIGRTDDGSDCCFCARILVSTR